MSYEWMKIDKDAKAMKRTIAIYFILGALNSLAAQDLDADCRVIPIHRKVNEIPAGDPYQSPLANYISVIHSWVDEQYAPLYSEMVDCINKAGTTGMSPAYAAQLLNSTIEEVIVYKDSVGCVIRKRPGQSAYFIIGFSVWENGKWKYNGEDICFSNHMADVHRHIAHKAATRALPALRKYYQQAAVSTDTLAFVNYLQQHATTPHAYLLHKLANYPLVIYGETHRRKVSWDFLQEVAYDPAFAEVCGTVFLELPFHTQARFNRFFANDALDAEIILDILRDEQQYGWQDKGMYEFIEALWKINKQADRKIQIIAVDFQIPWDSIKTNDDFRNYSENKMRDRDSTMAAIVETTLSTKTDTRNCLFIVGKNHARKSSPDYPVKAGALLAERLPEESLFSILTHAPAGTNGGVCIAPLRDGLFDYLFEKNGNTPVAFDLSGSPFGQEPFDALHEIRYEPGCGHYEDFYDGYIFLASLQNEEYDYTLFELFTDTFVAELKRRAFILNSPAGWYDIPAELLDKETITDHIKADQRRKNNKRWPEFHIPYNNIQIL
jgi:hypothetical protein